MQSRYGSYIGRVGALAVALGIGSAVAAPTGPAWASPDDSGATSSPSTAETSGGAEPASPQPAVEEKTAEQPADHEQAVEDRHPEDPEDPEGAELGPSDDVSADDVPTPKKKRSATRAHGDATADSATAERAPSAEAPPLAAADAAPPDEVAVSVAATQPSVTTVPTVLAARPVVFDPVRTVRDMISSALRPVLSTVLGMLPGGSADSPLAWLLLGAARREVGQTADPDIAGRQAAAAAVTNAAPTATIAWGRADPVTGTVVGKLTLADPEGKKVTAVLSGTAPPGALTYNTKTATITYTPTTEQRFAAWTTPSEDTAAITLTVTDRVNTVGVTLAAPVTKSPFYKVGSLTGVSDPSAVTMAGTRAYVTNRATGTVTVYDMTKNAVIATYAVGLTAPDGVAVKSDGTRLYVASSTENKVTVIDTKTGAVRATIGVVNPTVLAINPSGSTVYVASGSAATVTKINTSTNKAAGVVRLSAGLSVTEIAVTADGKRIYVAGAKPGGGGELSWFSSTATSATVAAGTASTPTGLALSRDGRAYVSDDGGAVVVFEPVSGSVGTISIGHPFAGIAISKDGSTGLVITTGGLAVALSTDDATVLQVLEVRPGLPAASVSPKVVLSPDGTQMLVTDLDSDTVHVLSLIPPNVVPFSSDPVYRVSDPAKGTLTGRVGVVDFDGDPLKYVLSVKPKNGKLVLNADGTYTYTPTAAARHAASVPGAAASVTTDSFTVVVSDGRYGELTQTITVAIDPSNKAPTVTTTIGNPSTSTGAVKVTVKTGDGDGDKRVLSVSGQPAKGTVTLTAPGVYTYTPDAAARAAAQAPGATHASRMDTFTVTVDDGHGGVVPVIVNVRIGSANIKPVWVNPVVGNADSRSGVVAGTFTSTDANGDPLSYTAGKTAKGTITIHPDGTFTYTPTAAARAAASKPKAAASTKSETITITVRDGFGGVTTASLKVAIGLNPATNTAPTNGQATVQPTSTALGTVTGTITADDADGDTLTYTVKTGPVHGVVKVTPAGAFTYTPDVDARYGALLTDGVDTDSFVVDIADGFGGIATLTVDVVIVPPSAAAIDQRATTVAVNTQQMIFYTQEDTDRALGLLKDAGVDTIRIALPWAIVEGEDDVFDWSAVDRIVDSAAVHGIKVLATINTTPHWAAIPGQPDHAGAPADLDAFEDFVTAVALRYRGRVHDYEVWNEPNYNGFWAPAPDAARYTELLKIAYTAIKAVDRNTTVIGGSVAAVAEVPGGPSVNPVTYLSQMYAAGAAGYFDALSYHPYLYTVPYSMGEGHAGVPFTQAQQLHALMVANGDGHKKIWATEYGQPHSEGGEMLQAAFIGDFLRAWRGLDFAGPAFLHTFADHPHELPTEATFGLFREDWTPKPALAVVMQVIAENAVIDAAAGTIV